MFYCCPAWAAEKRTGQGQIHSRSWSGGASAAVWDCGLLWWWLSLLAQIASAEDVSSVATSILFSLNLIVSSDDSSAVPITAWRSYLQKAAAGQCESCSLSTPGLFFLQRCYLCVHTTQYSSIPISPSHLSSETETTEWQREAKSRMAFFFPCYTFTENPRQVNKLFSLLCNCNIYFPKDFMLTNKISQHYRFLASFYMCFAVICLDNTQ